MSKISVYEGMEENELEYIRNQLFQYNINEAPPNEKNAQTSYDLHLVLKNGEGEIFGGLIGKIYRKCLFIDVLWIEKNQRKFGYGKELLVKAEEVAQLKGCKFIHLDTFSFQAPDFYKRNGYEIFGVLDGYSDGIKRYYFKKDL